MIRKEAIALFVGFGLIVAGCGGSSDSATEGGEAARKIRRAMAYIDPASESELMGTAIFINEPTQVALQIDVENAPPGTQIAVHIHENGDCSAADGKSAGGHWNPTGEDHGKWGVSPFHLGDIGNIEIGEDGKGSLTLNTDLWSVGSGGDNDIMGRAIIVHAEPDDYASQPSGAAGQRIGCGIIKEG